jgi:hypothetical protein
MFFGVLFEAFYRTLSLYYQFITSYDNSVNIVTGYRMNNQGSISGRIGIFVFVVALTVYLHRNTAYVYLICKKIIISGVFFFGLV